MILCSRMGFYSVEFTALKYFILRVFGRGKEMKTDAGRLGAQRGQEFPDTALCQLPRRFLPLILSSTHLQTSKCDQEIAGSGTLSQHLCSRKIKCNFQSCFLRNFFSSNSVVNLHFEFFCVFSCLFHSHVYLSLSTTYVFPI